MSTGYYRIGDFEDFKIWAQFTSAQRSGGSVIDIRGSILGEGLKSIIVGFILKVLENSDVSTEREE